MKSYLSEGFKLVKRHFLIVIFLFLYQLLWGALLYKMVSSAVIPLLMRYPNPPPHELSQILFWLEGQISLSTSSTVHDYVWLLVLMFILRMLITPLIRAGLFHSLHEDESTRGFSFFRGTLKHWKKTSLLYLIEIVLLLLPAYWIIPKVLPLLLNAVYNQNILLQAAPYVILWIIYAYIIKQLLLYVQFGLTGNRSGFSAVWVCIRHALPVTGVALTLSALAFILFSAFTAVSLIWTGLLALILQQSYHLIRSLINVWKISSQFSIWQSKSDDA
ncbi:hypothetical protein [Paenibacillus sp. 453mf]|uniref:hypothetical protein n=1 Tax=Paenibacillus sp. 453mf TaxID=1761874 RepID=UPI0008E47C4A|nr:hypothetical protein [Paenibacillus sp. 453mf]SFS98312.1 hypothetical protein SAMN04488601_11328 [Paenibacillus sp. 453mf]